MYGQGCTLFFCFHHLQLLLLSNSISHRNRKLWFHAYLMLLSWGFFCSSLPSATLLLHLTSPCLPHLPQHLPDWICWSSFSVYLIFPSADDYSNHWYLQNSGRYKQVSYILGATVMVQTISDKAKVIKNDFCQCTVEKILLWMRLLVLPVDACWEIEEGKVSVFSLK